MTSYLTYCQRVPKYSTGAQLLERYKTAYNTAKQKAEEDKTEFSYSPETFLDETGVMDEYQNLVANVDAAQQKEALTEFINGQFQPQLNADVNNKIRQIRFDQSVKNFGRNTQRASTAYANLSSGNLNMTDTRAVRDANRMMRRDWRAGGRTPLNLEQQYMSESNPAETNSEKVNNFNTWWKKYKQSSTNPSVNDYFIFFNSDIIPKLSNIIES